MILLNDGAYTASRTLTTVPFPVQFMMSDEEENEIEEPKEGLKTSMGQDWGESLKTERKLLFKNPDDFDIFCDYELKQNYIFHGPELGCTIDHLEYDPETQRIIVHTNDGQELDLGTRIQWLVRPYIAKEQDIFIIQTKDGEPIDGVEVHMSVRDPGGGEKTIN
jgi:hypothetical protein